ncbi:hypothetical protein BGZ65_001692 [Modicella reniformis]|uniref:Uncharacterized protein n=1 Tax=Modicella reniformis TaxID=1440133 RepID=A0A9P6M9Y8_9FUNG|nr:hypothetical protein BGZ65_001692 [Modicella reniformis]
MDDLFKTSELNIRFPCLKKLSVYFNDKLTATFLAPLLETLHHAHNLTHLEGSAELNQDFLDMIATKLPHLQVLIIRRTYTDLEGMFQLLKVCFNHPQLIDLRCHDFFFSGNTDQIYAKLLESLQDADKAKADAGEPTGLQLKSLILPHITGDGYPQSFMVPFLRSHVPNLERLGVPKMSPNDWRKLAEAIAEGCPKLQHITNDWFREDESHESLIIEVIRGCTKSGLRSYHGNEVIDCLVENHAITLEEIDITNGRYVRSDYLRSALTECRKLKRFCVKWHVGLSEIDFQDGLREWVCRDLQVLQLYLRRDADVPAGRVREEVVAQAGKDIFRQIGRLTKLEELYIVSVMSDGGTRELSLEHGWLVELAGLKELRHFEMRTDIWFSLGQAEVEFMDTNWPELRKIAIGYDPWRAEKLSVDSKIELAATFLAPLLETLHHAHNLTHFEVSAELNQDFLDMIATKLPHLQCLTLRRTMTDLQGMFQLLKVCFNHPQLIDLRCHDFFFSSKDQICDSQYAKLLESLQDADKAKADADEPTGRQLKSLILPYIVGDGYPQSFMVPFLRSHVPNLERLEVPKMSPNDWRKLTEAIAEGCPKLQHITNDWFREDESHESLIIEVIRGCTKSGLRSYHGKLKRFCVEWHTGLPAIDFRDGLREWVCRDLQVLQLYLRRDVDVPAGRVKKEVVAQAGKEIFRQIGRLTKLEELCLGRMIDARTKELSLEHGWLVELPGLKELRHFEMRTDLCFSVGQAEVEFMDTNWPELERITLAIIVYR